MKMTQQQIDTLEFHNYGKTKTSNIEFEQNGYLKVSNITDVSKIESFMPPKKGQYNFHGKSRFTYIPVENQVKGSISRYSFPPYRSLFFDIKSKVENILNTKLEPTYYFDRFYFPGQELTKHIDRDSCEISVTLHVRTNANISWPIYMKRPDVYDDSKYRNVLRKGSDAAIYLNPGDAVIYKGCERPHWRLPMPGEKRNMIRRLFNKPEIYYHQIFFHYVLSNGYRSHFAGDART